MRGHGGAAGVSSAPRPLSFRLGDLGLEACGAGKALELLAVSNGDLNAWLAAALVVGDRAVADTDLAGEPSQAYPRRLTDSAADVRLGQFGQRNLFGQREMPGGRILGDGHAVSV